MKAISLWQPWASLMAMGIKKIETRTWSTRYRGPLLIHAAKRKMDMIHSEAVARFEDFGIDWINGLPFGRLVCQVDLIDCIRITEGMPVSSEEYVHGDFTPGRFAWITDKLKCLKEPIPYRGWQRFFEVPDDIISLQLEKQPEAQKSLWPDM